MNDRAAATPGRASWGQILGYSTGQVIMSITFNAISACAMLYYTQALGLSAAKTGVAIGVGSLWDAIVDPTIGHLTDNTQNRWGRREPYILAGGLLMALSFYLVWAVPGFVIHGGFLFSYLLIVYLLYRTAYAVFTVPYVALGFEVCTDYHQRSQLQGVGGAVGMLANLLGPALGWSLFFVDRTGREATSVPANFIHMGTAFTIVTLIFTGVVVWTTWRYVTDTRGLALGTGNTLRAYFHDWYEIAFDRYFWPVLSYYCVGMIGTVFVGALQMYLYVYFAHLTALEKTVVHGGGMILCGAGGLLALPLARWYDKKYAACIGAAISTAADVTAVVLFAGGFLRPDATWTLGGHRLPLGIAVFGGCDMLNWLGVGIFMPLAVSMVADVAEVDELRSGVRKDGGYSALFAFAWKLVVSVASLGAAGCLTWAGFVTGSDHQQPEAIRRVIFAAFGLGALFSFFVIPLALCCKTDRRFMARVKEELARSSGLAKRPSLDSLRL